MSGKQVHVFFDGRGTQQLMNDIIQSLHPEYFRIPAVSMHAHDVSPWPSEVFAFALTQLLVNGHVSQTLSPAELTAQLKQQNGRAHGQRFFIVTVGL